MSEVWRRDGTENRESWTASRQTVLWLPELSTVPRNCCSKVTGTTIDQSTNLRAHFLRILRRAGLKPWPKLFQNMRSSRETELLNHFPPKAVCTWIGNSEAVAMEFYAQVTDDHFQAAIAGQSILKRANPSAD